MSMLVKYDKFVKDMGKLPPQILPSVFSTLCQRLIDEKLVPADKLILMIKAVEQRAAAKGNLNIKPPAMPLGVPKGLNTSAPGTIKKP